jgi:hypothetical protein
VPKRSSSGSSLILECYRRAAQAGRMADAATDRAEKADFREIEKRWLSLARNYVSETGEAASRKKPRRGGGSQTSLF